MNNKRIIILVTALLSLFAIPAANADVVVRYIVVNDGHSYREPFGYRQGSRMYSNTSRLGNITYSNRSRYRDRCDNYEPRQYRNHYYYGHQNRYQHDNRRGGSVYYRDNRRNNGHRNNRDAYHGYYRTPAYPNKRMHSDQSGRVHITIK